MLVKSFFFLLSRLRLMEKQTYLTRLYRCKQDNLGKVITKLRIKIWKILKNLSSIL